VVIYPAIVAAVGFVFAAILLRQYLDRRKPYQLVWTIALTIAGLAGLAFVLFLAADRSVLFFRLYYLFGAVLMAAYMGLGSVYLLAPRRAANITGIVVGALSLVGLVLMLTVPIHAPALQGSNVEAGSKAVTEPVLVAVLVLLNAFGATAVIGGAIYSAYRLFRNHGPVQLLAANILIATGTILASLAGTVDRTTGVESTFWSLLAAGFVVLFAGFLLTTRKTRSTTSPAETVSNVR